MEQKEMLGAYSSLVVELHSSIGGNNLETIQKQSKEKNLPMEFVAAVLAEVMLTQAVCTLVLIHGEEKALEFAKKILESYPKGKNYMSNVGNC